MAQDSGPRGRLPIRQTCWSIAASKLHSCNTLTESLHITQALRLAGPSLAQAAPSSRQPHHFKKAACVRFSGGFGLVKRELRGPKLYFNSGFQASSQEQNNAYGMPQFLSAAYLVLAYVAVVVRRKREKNPAHSFLLPRYFSMHQASYNRDY